MSTTHTKPSTIRRHPWLAILAAIITVLCFATVLMWGLLYNNVGVGDHETVADHTIYVSTQDR